MLDNQEIGFQRSISGTDAYEWIYIHGVCKKPKEANIIDYIAKAGFCVAVCWKNSKYHLSYSYIGYTYSCLKYQIQKNKKIIISIGSVYLLW